MDLQLARSDVPRVVFDTTEYCKVCGGVCKYGVKPLKNVAQVRRPDVVDVVDDLEQAMMNMHV